MAGLSRLFVPADAGSRRKYSSSKPPATFTVVSA